MKDVFRRVYREGWWGTGSGLGSTVEGTKEYRGYLLGIMHALNVRSVLDIGCGDWKFSRLIDWTGIDYIGWDVVPEIMAWDAQAFNITFQTIDARCRPLPNHDLIIIKDVFQHWSNKDILAFLEKLKGRRALITNSCWNPVNHDIVAGHFRPLDLRQSPFNLKPKAEFKWFAIPDNQDEKSTILLELK